MCRNRKNEAKLVIIEKRNRCLLSVLFCLRGERQYDSRYVAETVKLPSSPLNLEVQQKARKACEAMIHAEGSDLGTRAAALSFA